MGRGPLWRRICIGHLVLRTCAALYPHYVSVGMRMCLSLRFNQAFFVALLSSLLQRANWVQCEVGCMFVFCICCGQSQLLDRLLFLSLKHA
jgi:hypothetical protein